jgi:hypothetical protein
MWVLRTVMVLFGDSGLSVSPRRRPSANGVVDTVIKAVRGIF